LKNGDAVILLHIRDALVLVLEYAGVGKQAFQEDVRTQDAILRRLEIVGEATKRLTPTFRAAHPNVPWKRIAGFRDIAIHHYDKIDLEVVWRLVEHEAPILLQQIRDLLDAMGEKR
jgi:uncharacterized protein with HEPN domain